MVYVSDYVVFCQNEREFNVMRLKYQCPSKALFQLFTSMLKLLGFNTHAVKNFCFHGFQMDALNSHSSKSYYACVGESTHAYQSPSKDLTAINNRLNRYAFLLAKLYILLFRRSNVFFFLHMYMFI